MTGATWPRSSSPASGPTSSSSSRRAASRVAGAGPFAGDVVDAERSLHVLGMEPGQAQRRRSTSTRPRADAVLAELCAGADVVFECGRRPGRPRRAAGRQPGARHRVDHAVRLDRPEGRLAGHRPHRAWPPAASWRSTGDDDRAPVRTAVPQAFLHASADAAVGACVALTERATQRARPARRDLGPALGACRRRRATRWPCRSAGRPRAAGQRRRQDRWARHQAAVAVQGRLRVGDVPVRRVDRPVHRAADGRGSTRRAAATRRRGTRTGSTTPTCSTTVASRSRSTSG